MVSLFVFAYYSFKDPVFQSAVLPYLKAVSSSKLRFIVLTWEQDQFAMDQQAREEVKKALLVSNIVWYDTKWHSGKYKLVKKAFDLIKGIVLSCILIRRYRTRKIYSEGFPGAIIGHYLSLLTRSPHIIHTFEPHAEYMLEAGVWTKSSWEYKLLRRHEKALARHAESIVTGTSAYKDILVKLCKKDHVFVVPSCVDTDHYRFDARARSDLRRDLGIRADQIAIAYLGKLGGMYMDDEIFLFFKHCLQLQAERFFFFLFTNEDIAKVRANLEQFNIPMSKVFVSYLDRDEVPGYLSAADIGFCGIRPLPSRRYSSPIKNGEYWACGLPILVPHGISDDYLDSSKHNIGFSFSWIEEITLPVLESLRQLDRTAVQRKGYSLRALASYQTKISSVLVA